MTNKERKIRRIFSKYVPTNELDELLSNPELVTPNRLQPRNGGILFVMVKGDTPEQVAASMGQISNILVSNRIIIYSMISGLIIAMTVSENARDQIDTTIQQITAAVLKNCKITYRFGDASVGSIGTEGHQQHSFIVKDFDKIVSRLINLPYGKCEEF